MAQPRQFIDSVKEALDAEYGFDLQKEVALPKGQGFFFDLADIAQAVVVEIRPASDVDEIEFTSVRFPPNSGPAEKMFGEDLRYFLVYETEMYSNDKFDLESILEKNMRGRLTVLDMTDIFPSTQEFQQEYSPEQSTEGTKISEEKEEKPESVFNETFSGEFKKKEPDVEVPFERTIQLKENATLRDIEEVRGIPPEDVIREAKRQGVEITIDEPATSEILSRILSENYSTIIEFIPGDNEVLTERVAAFLNLPEEQNRAFFVVATQFNGEDFSEKFSQEGIWENLNSGDAVTGFNINHVNVGDVIFPRFEDNSPQTNVLFTRGGGIVTGNPKDGRSLKVNWILKNFVHQIPDMLWYNNYIEAIIGNDLYRLLDYMTDSEMQSINREAERLYKASIQTIAGLISDSDSGTDYLDITKDVAAFSRVIAAKSFIPPLAIALFGKWGSGKSFFMRKLQEQITTLANQNTNDMFCSGIAQVHFNAWSYLDSNLWASMVSRIFEGLQEYISQDTLAKIEKETVEKSLIGKLNSSNERIALLQNEKEQANAKLSDLRKKKRKIKYLLKKKLERIGKDKLFAALKNADEQFKVDDRITKAISDNKDFIKNKEQFEKIVPKTYWKTPDQLYERTKSASTFLSVFFNRKKWWKNILWLLLIIAIIVLVPKAVSIVVKWFGGADMSLPQNAWALITVLGGVGVKGINVYNKMQPLVDSFWKIKKEYDTEMAQAKVDFEKKQANLAREIEVLTAAINEVDLEIAETISEKAEIEFRLKHTLSSEAMFSFIERRSESEEYSKHLGIISVIRKDFEILSELFTDHNSELQTVQTNKKDTKLFYKLFERPLERIILYIDDLDRCPEERVVEVLEAVNLLMAFPLFVVVVGVDPRWVKNALYKKHKLQFEEAEQAGEMELISPSAYLEKIFQVPFNLKSASDTSIKHMLKTLAETKPPEIKKEADSPKIESGEDTVTKSPVPSGTVQTEGEPEPEKPKVEQEDKPGNDIPSPNQPEVEKLKEKSIPMPIESLTFSTEELGAIQQMSKIIGPSPRAIKRFVNIFRIIKAHEDYPNTLSLDATKGVLFLLALPIGPHKNFYAEIIDQIELQENLPPFTLKDFLVLNGAGTITPNLLPKNEAADRLLDDSEGFSDITFEGIRQNYPLIKRFSYISN